MGRLTLEDVTKFLISFDNFLKKPTHIGLIGGAALLIFKIRPSTHDIDIVFFDKGGLAESSHFLEDYSKVNEVEIQYGMSGRFASMLINEDMFKHSKVVPGIEETFFHTYKFRNLHIHILEPKYFALVKVEAASKGGPHLEDAINIIKHFGVKRGDMVSAYKEYKAEIEIIPQMTEFFNTLMEECYHGPFDIRMHV